MLLIEKISVNGAALGRVARSIWGTEIDEDELGVLVFPRINRDKNVDLRRWDLALVVMPHCKQIEPNDICFMEHTINDNRGKNVANRETLTRDVPDQIKLSMLISLLMRIYQVERVRNWIQGNIIAKREMRHSIAIVLVRNPYAFMLRVSSMLEGTVNVQVVACSGH